MASLLFLRLSCPQFLKATVGSNKFVPTWFLTTLLVGLSVTGKSVLFIELTLCPNKCNKVEPSANAGKRISFQRR